MNKLARCNGEFSALDISSFAKLVRAMRETQKRYFKTRDVAVLKDSKSLEIQVDSTIEKILAVED